MSTSPSWFDQEKFSRLVKKVGTKPPPQPVVEPDAPDKPPVILNAPTVTGLLPLSIKDAATAAASKKTGALPSLTPREGAVAAAPAVEKTEASPGPVSKEPSPPPTSAPLTNKTAPVSAPVSKETTPAPTATPLVRKTAPVPLPVSNEPTSAPESNLLTRKTNAVPLFASKEPVPAPTSAPLQRKTAPVPLPTSDVTDFGSAPIAATKAPSLAPPLPASAKAESAPALLVSKETTRVVIPPKPAPPAVPTLMVPAQAAPPLASVSVSPAPASPALSPPAPKTATSPAPDPAAAKPAFGAKPPGLPVPHVARRTTPLPGLKSIFEYEKPEKQPEKPAVARAPVSKEALESPTSPSAKWPTKTTSLALTSFPKEEKEKKIDAPRVVLGAPVPEAVTAADEREEAASAWEKVALLNAELLEATQERDKVLAEASALRAQLDRAGTATKETSPTSDASEEVAQLTDELEQARAEADALREQLAQAEEKVGNPAAAPADDLDYVTTERDNIRRDYAALRQQFEKFKRDRAGAKADAGEKRPVVDTAQIDALKQQLAEREKELAAVKTSAPVTEGMEETVKSLKQELNEAQQQAKETEEEMSTAQRGLALSQKALQETRDALREATEGNSSNKGNLENLKKECSTLVQQNMLLQAQYDQASRELSALKVKVAKSK
jgi:hypothetical protein